MRTENEVKRPRRKMPRKYYKQFRQCIGPTCARCSVLLGCNPANPMYGKNKKEE